MVRTRRCKGIRRKVLDAKVLHVVLGLSTESNHGCVRENVELTCQIVAGTQRVPGTQRRFRDGMEHGEGHSPLRCVGEHGHRRGEELLARIRYRREVERRVCFEVLHTNQLQPWNAGTSGPVRFNSNDSRMIGE